MYTFNWALTAFRSESYIGSATALPDMCQSNTLYIHVYPWQEEGMMDNLHLLVRACLSDVAHGVKIVTIATQSVGEENGHTMPLQHSRLRICAGHLLTSPMRGRGYSTHSVCLSVCLLPL